MKSSISLIALAAACVSIVSAAPTSASNKLVSRSSSCSSCDYRGVPNAIVVLADVVKDFDAKVNEEVVGLVDVSAEVISDITARLEIVAAAIDTCKNALIVSAKADVDVDATVKVFGATLVKLDAALQRCGQLDADVKVKVEIWAIISAINNKCGFLVSTCARIFLGSKAKLLAKVGVLICLRAALGISL